MPRSCSAVGAARSMPRTRAASRCQSSSAAMRASVVAASRAAMTSARMRARRRAAPGGCGCRRQASQARRARRAPIASAKGAISHRRSVDHGSGAMPVPLPASGAARTGAPAPPRRGAGSGSRGGDRRRRADGCAGSGAPVICNGRRPRLGGLVAAALGIEVDELHRRQGELARLVGDDDQVLADLAAEAAVVAERAALLGLQRAQVGRHGARRQRRRRSASCRCPRG